LGHCYIGCEHLLLAVANSSSRVTSAFGAAGASPAALDRSLADVLGHPAGGPDDRSALASLGIDLDEVRRVVESTFGTGSLDLAAQATGKRSLRRWLGRRRCETPPGRALGHVPFTPRAKRCLELSLREALALGHPHIGVEHIALALLACDDTMAWRMLVHLGIEPPNLRRQVLASLRRTA
jgi:hypothetical protein